MAIIALSYTVFAGLYGVAYTDFFQFAIMAAAALTLSFKAALLPDHAQVLATAGAEWASVAPRMTADPMPWLLNPNVYRLFGLCVVVWILKSVVDGLGGTAGGYMPQRYYAAKDERAAGLMTVQWVLLLTIRWSMVAGIAFLGIWIASHDPATAARLTDNPEQTLPVVLGTVLPHGMLGIAIAGLVAAEISTIESVLNAGAAYWVRDIYHRFLRRGAGERELVRQGYAATVALAALGVVLAIGVKNIDEIWNWITGPLSGGILAPLVMRWYWWRFNGDGFAWGTGAGLTAALFIGLFWPETPFYLSIAITTGISTAVGVAVSLATQAVDEERLRAFYRQMRPFGFWGRLPEEIPAAERAAHRRESRLDLLNMLIALVWQVSLFLGACLLVLRDWQGVGIAWGISVALGAVLYFTWYRTLPASDTTLGTERSDSVP